MAKLTKQKPSDPRLFMRGAQPLRAKLPRTGPIHPGTRVHIHDENGYKLDSGEVVECPDAEAGCSYCSGITAYLFVIGDSNKVAKHVRRARLVLDLTGQRERTGSS